MTQGHPQRAPNHSSAIAADAFLPPTRSQRQTIAPSQACGRSSRPESPTSEHRHSAHGASTRLWLLSRSLLRDRPSRGSFASDYVLSSALKARGSDGESVQHERCRSPASRRRFEAGADHAAP